MAEQTPRTMEDFHRHFARTLFNRVWELLEKPKRTADEEDEIIHAAHASRYHWGVVGKPVNKARGEWQVSRVYSVLGWPCAVHHAQRCLEICEKNGIGGFDIAAAYEALARAHAVAGDSEQSQKYLALGLEAAEHVTDAEDRQVVLDDLRSITGAPAAK